MTLLDNSIAFLTPYEFSPTLLLACVAVAWLYIRGRRAAGTQGRLQTVLFWLGLVLIYGMLQTQYDFYAQHMFFLHRLQHLILHHLAPFLIALVLTREQLLAGLPVPLRRHIIDPLWHSRLMRGVIIVIQQPLVSSVLFVGLIYFWLIPDIHFIAMLNVPLYNAMNWGMALDGLLFWWMVFNMRADGSSAERHYGGRIVLLFLVMFPQIVIGAHIALSNQDLFDVYAVCGRAWPLSAHLDQQIGGLITWIHAPMMSVVGALVLMQRWRHERELNVTRGETCRVLT